MERKEAMKILKDFYDKSALFSIRTALDTVIPELAESEDERIKEWLINLAKGHIEWLEDRIGEQLSNGQVYGGELVKAKNSLAWLERQGEHANFRNKIQIGDKVTRNEEGMLVNLSQLKRVAKPADVVEKQGEPIDKIVKKPQRIVSAEAKEAMYGKPAWSEEDEEHIKRIIEHFEGRKKDLKTQWVAELHNKEIDWLKSLKDRYTWKPSGEQMSALRDISLAGCISYAGQGQELINLYHDLKKLKS